MKIRIKDRNQYGQTHFLQDVGEVKLDEEGIVDVPEETALAIIEGSSDWEAIEEAGEATQKSKSVKVTSKKVQQKELSKKEKDAVREKLMDFDTDELKDMVKKLNTPSSEQEKFMKNRTLMTSYLINKIDPDDLREIIA